MTETSLPTTTDQRRGRAGVAVLSLAAGALFGIAGTVLATDDNDVPVRPTVVQRLTVDRPASADDVAESPCQRASADASERCFAARAESSCHLASADASERCVANRAVSG
jgi:hypothetical protein